MGSVPLPDNPQRRLRVYIGLGYLSWGVSGRIYDEGQHAIAITSRFVAPTTTGLDQGSQPFALDVGATAAFQADASFRFHMWLVLLGSAGAGGPAEPRAGLRVGGGVDWRPFEWISFVLEAATGLFYRDVLDFIAANVGFRLALGSDVGLELGVQLPIVGQRAFDDGALRSART